MPATTKNYPAIIELWEQSVRETHHFLPEEYLPQIKTLVPSIFPAIQLFINLDENKNIAGFSGVTKKRKLKCYLFIPIAGTGYKKTIDRICCR